jgi:hypothetical protein
MDAVLRYHKGMGLKGNPAQLHAIVHTAVENQLADGHEGARRTLDRLVAEGLTRHEAIHALCMPFSEQMLATLKHGLPFNAAEYEHALDRLTAQSWKALAGDQVASEQALGADEARRSSR